jgi:hypothetical protein
MGELAVREETLVLDDREADGISVELLYRTIGKEVLIHLIDTKDDRELLFPIPAESAQDAFTHPYAYYQEFLEHAA